MNIWFLIDQEDSCSHRIFKKVILWTTTISISVDSTGNTSFPSGIWKCFVPAVSVNVLSNLTILIRCRRLSVYKTVQILLLVGIYLKNEPKMDIERLEEENKLLISFDCQNVLKKFKGVQRIWSVEQCCCYEGNVLQFKCIIKHWPLLSLAISGFQ